MLLHKKDEDTAENPFARLDRAIVLQEAKVFNDSQLNPKKCIYILVKMLYLLYQGEQWSTKDATELFFLITKLFQSGNLALRRMMYLMIKELSNVSEDVIIVTSSLMKDMNAKQDPVFRANAIRALCCITNSSMLQGIERFLKQSIVDKQPYVSSASLVSTLHLFSTNREIVKRWVNEVQEALTNKATMTQYHALGLLYQLKQNDHIAVAKTLQSLIRTGVRSPLAQCMLIRYVCKCMEEGEMNWGGIERENVNPSGMVNIGNSSTYSSTDGMTRAFYEYLENCLRNKHEMVVYEAARGICFLKNVNIRDLSPAVSVLQLFLSSPKSTLRFAAIHTLSRIAIKFPTSIVGCNTDMENLVTDTNRSIATLAITTLLKTGNEMSVDRLMKQITAFMSEISDEFKIVIMEAVQALCIKFPSKQTVLLTFLSNALRDEGGYEYKRSILDVMCTIIREMPESKESAISHLCEFIEDCEYPALSVRVLHLLGMEGPRLSQPSKCIRYIYNRIILENSIVRAAAVSALGKFGAMVEILRPSVIVLLSACLMDSDDEVRDRATFFIHLLQNGQEQAIQQHILNETGFAYAALERALVNYCSNPVLQAQGPFDISSIPMITRTQELADKRAAVMAMSTSDGQGAGVFVDTLTGTGRPLPSGTVMSGNVSMMPGVSVGTAALSTRDHYAEQLIRVLGRRITLGPLFHSSKPVQLTEAETEYVIECIKHIFPRYIVFQFNCRNTLNDQVLEQVRVEMDSPAIVAYWPVEIEEEEQRHSSSGKDTDVDISTTSDESSSDCVIQSVHVHPLKRLLCERSGSTYVVYRKPKCRYPIGVTFANTLKFRVHEVEPGSVPPPRSDEGTDRSGHRPVSPDFLDESEEMEEKERNTIPLDENTIKSGRRDEASIAFSNPDLISGGPGGLSVGSGRGGRPSNPTFGKSTDNVYEDEYVLENVEISLADFIIPSFVSDYKSAWETLGQENEVKETYQIGSMSSIGNALQNLQELFGMEMYRSSSGGVSGASSASETVFMSGIFVTGTPIFIRARLAYEKSTGITMELSVRCLNHSLHSLIMQAIH